MTEDAASEKRNEFLNRALGETLSNNQFNSEAIRNLAETLSDTELIQEQHDQDIEHILLDTLADSSADLCDDDEEHESISDQTFSFNNNPEDSINQKIPGRYSITSVLGSGATGQVFALHDNNFRRDIAVKFLHPKYLSNKSKMQLFVNEARITAKLNHPNILPIHDFDFTNGALIYFTMGKVEGSSLQELLQQAEESGVLPGPIRTFNDRIRIIQQICHAISYAHSQGVIHKDIKPSNIMIGHYGEVLLVDWGTASKSDDDENTNNRLAGTPLYMSPEQARREQVDNLSDIYCIGSTFFHLLTLRYPCWNNDLDTFWDLKSRGEYRKPDKQELRQIPRQLLTIAEKAMAADKDKRYQQAADINHDLEAYQQGRSVSAYHENLWEFMLRFYTYNKAIVTFACIGLLLIAGTGNWLYNEIYQAHGAWETVEQKEWQKSTLGKLQSQWDFASLAKLNKHDKSHALLPVSDPETDAPSKDIDLFIKDSSLISLNGGEILLGPSSNNQIYNLRFKHRITGSMRISWEQHLSDGAQNIQCFIGGKTSSSSYAFFIRYFDKKIQLTFRKLGNVIDSKEIILNHTNNQKNHLSMQKDSQSISLSIDHNIVYQYNDPEMLNGARYQQFGFTLNDNSSSISNIHIQRQRLPDKQEPIAIANDYFSNQLYDDARLHYKNIRKMYPGTYLSPLALYRMARCSSELGSHREALISYQHFLQDYKDHNIFPHAVIWYIIELANTEKWKQCEEALKKHLHTLNQTYLRRHLSTALRSITSKQILTSRDPTLLHLRASLAAKLPEYTP